MSKLRKRCFLVFDILIGLLIPAYWIQCISAAVFCYLVLEDPKEGGTAPTHSLLCILKLMLLFLSIHVVLSVLTLTYRFLAGVGTWLAYMGGVVLYTVFSSKCPLWSKWVNGAAASSIVITIFELGAVLGGFISFYIPGFDSVITKALGCVLLLFTGWFMRKYRLSKYDVSPHAAQLNLVACTVSAICVMVYDLCLVNIFHMRWDPGVSGLMSVVMLALFVMDTVCYFMTCHMSREYTTVISLTAENQMNKSAESLMAVTEENLAEIHKIRHDIQNQYAYMRTMLDSGDVEGLRRYFDELTSTFAAPLGSVEDYGNHAMNLILHMESTKARNAGVEIEVKAMMPHQLPFRERDLVKLYTNVIDNAIEACVAEGREKATVSITINVVGQYLFTRIQNPTRKEKSFLDSGLKTTKGDDRVHGKGMSIVRGIVQKYDGSIRYAIKDGVFIVEFMLCLEETQHE